MQISYPARGLHAYSTTKRLTSQGCQLLLKRRGITLERSFRPRSTFNGRLSLSYKASCTCISEQPKVPCQPTTSTGKLRRR